MSRPQPPGTLSIPIQRGGSLQVGAHPSEGVFVLSGHSSTDRRAPVGIVDLKLNRSEFAALHAAMGELLAFYREEALDR